MKGDKGPAVVWTWSSRAARGPFLTGSTACWWGSKLPVPAERMQREESRGQHPAPGMPSTGRELAGPWGQCGGMEPARQVTQEALRGQRVPFCMGSGHTGARVGGERRQRGSGAGRTSHSEVAAAGAAGGARLRGGGGVWLCPPTTPPLSPSHLLVSFLSLFFWSLFLTGCFLVSSFIQGHLWDT